MDEILNKFIGYLTVIRPVLPQFLLALVVASGAIWWLLGWYYGGRLESKDDQISLLVRQRDDALAQRAGGTQESVGGFDLRPLMEAFERHAGEEAYIATQLKFDIPYVRHDQKGVSMPFLDKPLTPYERSEWSGFLRRLDAECVKLGFGATQGAIRQALTRFDDELSRVSAWSEYNKVSSALKDEIGRIGRFVPIRK